MLIWDTIERWLPFGVENTVALFFSVFSHSDSKLTKAQAEPLPPPQAGPHLLNSLLSLQAFVMFVIHFTGYRCAQLEGMIEYQDFYDCGINFHINTGYMVNVKKFWKQSFLFAILSVLFKKFSNWEELFNCIVRKYQQLRRGSICHRSQNYDRKQQLFSKELYHHHSTAHNANVLGASF